MRFSLHLISLMLVEIICYKKATHRDYINNWKSLLHAVTMQNRFSELTDTFERNFDDNKKVFIYKKVSQNNPLIEGVARRLDLMKTISALWNRNHVRPSVCLSFYRCVCLSFRLYVYLSVFLSGNESVMLKQKNPPRFRPSAARGDERVEKKKFSMR